MFKARVLVPILFIASLFAWLSSHGVWKRLNSRKAIVSPTHYLVPVPFLEKLKNKAEAAKAFIRKESFNSSICFLVDMSLPSGQNRFFVYDLEKDSIKNAGLVAHGRCNQFWLEGRKYGNTVGCGCTSLGKYKIGNPYVGRFGQAFKLYGLDKTNDQAFNRFVVLHSYSYVPETEVKDEICQSDGCPMVAPGFLAYLTPILNTSKRPVLLWIYE